MQAERKFIHVFDAVTNKEIEDVDAINTYAFPHKVRVLMKDKKGDLMVDKKTQEVMKKWIQGSFRVVVDP